MRTLGRSGQLWHLTLRCRYSTKPAGWDEARPLSECPKLVIWDVFKGLMPNGRFQNKDTNEMVQIIHAEKGAVIYLPGFLGRSPMLLTKNPDDFETVLRNEGIWPERIGMEILHHYRNERRKDFFGEASGLLTSHGKKWGEFRSAVNPILMNLKNVKTYLPVMSQVNEEFIERIKEIRDPHTLEVPGTFQQEINRWTLESVSLVALDTKLNLLKSADTTALQYFKNLQRIMELSIDLEGKPSLWRYIPDKKYKECMKLLDDAVDFTEAKINEAMKRINDDNGSNEKPDAEKSVLEKLLKVNKNLAMIMAMDMLFGGVDSTTSTFAGIMLCLAKHPEKQDKLRQEIMNILPQKNSPLTVDNMQNLPYLRACLKESLRVYPLTSALARRVPIDLVLSGYQVPAGTGVVLFHADVAREEGQFAKPKEYIPERWLRSSVQESVNGCPMKASNPFVYLPFGFGPRACIGRRIAEMELEIGVVRIIRNFKVEFNYSVEKPFQSNQIFTPRIPLKFKFIDLEN